MGADIDWQSLTQAFGEAEAESKLAKYRRRKWERSTEFAGWIKEAALAELSIEQARSLYTSSGGTHRKDFESNPIGEIRDSLDFLLYDTVKLEGRFQECADDGGAFKLAGAGKDFISYLLCLSEPRLFAVWNNNAEKAFRKLSQKLSPKLGIEMNALRRGPMGIGYIDLLEGSDTVRRRLGVADFRSVDEFFYFISRPGA
jgi:hypothetical protein